MVHCFRAQSAVAWSWHSNKETFHRTKITQKIDTQVSEERHSGYRVSEIGGPMSVNVVIELPDDTFSVLNTNADVLAREIRIAAAVKWYEIGLISQAKAAELAGLSRTAFIEALSRFSVSPFQETPEELEQEFARG